ncbi:MAG: hypothetical protein CBB79_01345 [Synechococcus sp. TMED19]|nr:MAG: hypothetical protein CBB79_01345 [Synechococcus sp. TMED19]
MIAIALTKKTAWHAELDPTGSFPALADFMDSDLYLLAWSKLQEAAFLWLSDVPLSVSAREELQSLMQRISPSQLAAIGARLRPLLSDSEHVQNFIEAVLAPRSQTC